MRAGRQDSKIEYDQLSQYIEGWLQYKENRKFERYWFVLRGNVIDGRGLCTAYLFCFKDLNIHVEEHVIGSIEIHSHDKVEFLKSAGNRPMKCDFTILLADQKYHFRADDEISRERWIYALCELVGKCQPPSELPTEKNKIRASTSHPKKGAFHRSKTVELPTAKLPGTRRQSLFARSTNFTLPSSPSLQPSFDNSPPVSAPPRSASSLPYIVAQNARLQDLPWFYPGMRRDIAQQKLMQCPVGYYLLRDSETKVGSYTLSFRDTDRLKNHMIVQSSDRLYRFHNSEVDNAFESPQKAVEFYMTKKHSKHITPTPYIDYTETVDECDMDYLQPSEMNVSSPPRTRVPAPRPPETRRQSSSSQQSGVNVAVRRASSSQDSRYTHRDLPPTPGLGAPFMNKLSLDENVDDGEPYLDMNAGELEQASQGASKTSSGGRDDAYLKLGLPPVDDSDGYLEMSDPHRSGDANSSQGESDDDDPDYFEYERVENGKPASNEDRPRKPALPLKSQDSISFSQYDDVNLVLEYVNQISSDDARAGAPPIPPRNSKPGLPPRRETSS